MNNQKELRRLFFYVEPSTLRIKLLCDYNTYFANYLLDNSKSGFSNLNFFFVTILFKKKNIYSMYWKEIKAVVDKYKEFNNKQPECIFFAYGIEMHRLKKIKKTYEFKLNDIIKNPKLLLNYNKKYNTNLQLINNNVYDIINDGIYIDNNVLTGLPHLHCVVCYNFFKGKQFNNIFLQESLNKFFNNEFDIEVEEILAFSNSNVNIKYKHLINVASSLNYIWKNYNALDVNYNLSLFYNDFFPLGVYIFNNSLYNFIKQYNDEYKKSNIYLYYEQNLWNNEYFYNKTENLYLCANELLYFLINNQNLYRVDKDFNFYKLQSKTQFTFNLFYEFNLFKDCIHFLYTNNFIKNPFFFNICLQNNYISELKNLILIKLPIFNYIFFSYSGFEFLDVILDNHTLSIRKKSDVPFTFTCFRFFDRDLETFVKSLTLTHYKIHKFLYYNNLSFDFFLYLGLFLNQLTKPDKSLLQVSLFFYGSSQSNKTTFLTALMQSLFGSEKDTAFNLGTTKDLSSFKTQLLDKNILWYDDFRYKKKDNAFILSILSNSFKFKEVKFETAKTIKNNPIAFFTAQQSPLKDILAIINKSHSQFIEKNSAPINVSIQKQNYILERKHNFVKDLLLLKPQDVTFLMYLMRLKINDKNFLNNIAYDRFLELKSRNNPYNLAHHFSLFKSFLDDLSESEERAFLRRIILFNFDIPITQLYSSYKEFLYACDYELSSLIILSFFITGVCFKSHFSFSNIDSYISKDKLSLLFNNIFELGSSSSNFDSLYKLKKEEFFYQIPIRFKNISFLIARRLELPQYEVEIESILQFYLSAFYSTFTNKDDLYKFLKTNSNYNHDFVNLNLLPVDYLNQLEKGKEE
jgi:hypothetical protein